MSAGKSDYTLIPDWWIAEILPTRPGLFRIACRLAHYAKDGITFVSATRLAKDLELTREHVTREFEDLRNIGAIVPTGRLVSRAREYRILARPVTPDITGSSDGDHHTLDQRPVISYDASCDDGHRRPVTTAIHTNGIDNGINNDTSSRDAASLSLADGETSENPAKPHEPSAEDRDASEAAGIIERLVGHGMYRSVALALVRDHADSAAEWAYGFDAASYPELNNPGAFLRRRIEDDDPGPERDPFGVCPKCNAEATLCYGPDQQWCYDCAHAAIKNAQRYRPPARYETMIRAKCDRCGDIGEGARVYPFACMDCAEQGQHVG